MYVYVSICLCVVLLTSSIWSVQQPAGCASTHGWSDWRPAKGGANGVDVCADCVIPIGIFENVAIVSTAILASPDKYTIFWKSNKFFFLLLLRIVNIWQVALLKKMKFEHKCQHNLHTNLTLLRTHGLCRCWWSKTFAQRFGLQWQH